MRRVTRSDLAKEKIFEQRREAEHVRGTAISAWWSGWSSEGQPGSIHALGIKHRSDARPRAEAHYSGTNERLVLLTCS
ncbi:unnamed protein product [Strongylus vulgaris]|uniref:Uncharacterized protein n=1 Tax=Strongylus vulgaris TaxID=40348 RepID=A0A3P7KWA5_STRVU|nr:unnamed protein product [Strongylus vulgaris]